jgi:LCP family protein required for cell wall assembly
MDRFDLLDGDDLGPFGYSGSAVATPDSPPVPSRPRPRGNPPRGRPRRRHRVLRWTALVSTVLLVVVTLAAYLEYRHLLGNIGREDVAGLLGKRPPKYNSALNILIVGSDSRAGSNARYGQGVQGARSDTMMLMHISPHRNGVTMISFPRDSMVQQIACKGDNQGHSGQQADNTPEQLNATFDSGGAPCLWKSLETVTGVHIDHFVQLDFVGFQTMVNAVGGVSVCLPQAVQDPASKLNLGAGVHHVNGAQALAFVRERHIGTGSDLQRIQRQQYFMAALTKEALSSNVLGNPGKLYALANAVTKSLTVDSQLSVSNMVQIAQSMRSTKADSVRFLSVPTVPDPDNSNRVDFDPAAAPQLFDAIKYDQTVTHAPAKKTAKKTAAKGKAKPAAPPPKPGQVKVQVLNGSTVAGLAGQTGTQLGQQGFNVLGTGNATQSAPSTVIQYASPGDLPAAQTLQGALTGAKLQQVASLQPGTVTLVLGSSFQGLKPPSDLTKQYGGITGNANICKDSAAFAGPDNPGDFAP